MWLGSILRKLQAVPKLLAQFFLSFVLKKQNGTETDEEMLEITHRQK